MYTKEEKRQLAQRFWSQFNLYCNNIPALAGNRKKWILHDTKLSHIKLKFDLGNKVVLVAMEINHRSESRRLNVFELITRYKTLLEQGFEGGLIWDYCYQNENGQDVCRIYTAENGLDWHKSDDWLQIFDFFARNMGQLQENFIEIQEFLTEELNQLYRED